MKFHWGTAVFSFLGLFVLALIFILYKSRQVDHSLVLDKYYEEDLAFQSKYEKMDNYSNLSQKISIAKSPEGDTLFVRFPYEQEREHIGKLTFYRANANKEDESFDIKTDKNSLMKIPLHSFSSGKWTIKIVWQWGELPSSMDELVFI